MRLTGGQALARQLVLEGIADVFGIPGALIREAVWQPRSGRPQPVGVEIAFDLRLTPWPYMRLRGGKTTEQLPDIRRAH